MARFRLAWVALLFIASAAQAQRGALVAPLPEGLAPGQILEITSRVLLSQGWRVSVPDDKSVLADKSQARMRIFVENGALTYYDVSRRAGKRASPFVAVPQSAIDELQGALTAALSAPGGAAIAAPLPPPAKLLVGNIPAVDPQRLMDTVRAAFGARGWQMLPDEDSAIVAHLRNGDGDARLKVFFADGALRYVDQSTRRGVADKAPERWVANLRSDIGRALMALPTQPQASTQAKSDEPGERLRKLKAMLDAGLISPSEYENKRTEILKGL